MWFHHPSQALPLTATVPRLPNGMERKAGRAYRSVLDLVVATCTAALVGLQIRLIFWPRLISFGVGYEDWVWQWVSTAPQSNGMTGGVLSTAAAPLGLADLAVAAREKPSTLCSPHSRSSCICHRLPYAMGWSFCRSNSCRARLQVRGLAMASA